MPAPAYNPSGMADLWQQIRVLPHAVWLRATAYGIGAALLIGVPSDVIDTPFFGRPVDVRFLDYLLLVITSALIGLILATRPDTGGEAVERQDTTTLWGGFVSFLAVGCPVCNQAVVALVGISGALSWWAPVQPLIGIAAIALLLWTLRRRLGSCRVETSAKTRPGR